uniref:Uncharacterized protein n=1 Tax=Mycena chlorophos TaxID=658473 RepID=A0ABQ0M3N1_MYCCL|nr:predicted protein [Mycena chlorophos]
MPLDLFPARLLRRSAGGLRPPDPPPEHPSRTVLALDGLRTTLQVLKESSDIFPPLKSSVSGVLSLWDLVERLDSVNGDVAALASRASSILLAMNCAAGADPQTANLLLNSPEVLRPIDTLNSAILGIGDVLANLPSKGVKRLKYLRQNELRLVALKDELVAAQEAFIVGMHTVQSLQTAKMADTTTSIASNISDVNASLSVVTGEITKLRTQVHFLQVTVVFLA